MRRTIIPLALAATLGAGLLGCSSPTTARTSSAPSAPAPTVTVTARPSPSPSPTPSVTTDPQTYDGVRAVLKKLDTLTARHDWGGEWDLMTSTGKREMTRTDYIYVVSHCTSLYTKDTVLSFSLNDANTVATVTSKSADDTTYTWTLVYEDGHWLHQPSDGALQWMTLSRTKALKYLAPC